MPEIQIQNQELQFRVWKCLDLVFLFGVHAQFQTIPARNLPSWVRFSKPPGAAVKLKICSGQLVNFSEQGVVMWMTKLQRCPQDYSVASSLIVAIFLMIIIFFFKLQLLKGESQFSLHKKQISSSFCCKGKIENETLEHPDILETPKQILLLLGAFFILIF